MVLMPLLSRLLFFQAEDGIRDVAVTGVQTCALPICRRHPLPSRPHGERGLAHRALAGRALVHAGRVALRAVGVAFPRRGDSGATARALSAPRLRGGGARAARGPAEPVSEAGPDARP